MFVKPGPRQDDRDRRLAVRGPNGRLLSALGEPVPDTQFWHRRLRDGDVVAAEPYPPMPAIQHSDPGAPGRPSHDGDPSDPLPTHEGCLAREASP
jgi:hypothetical protein